MNTILWIFGFLATTALLWWAMWRLVTFQDRQRFDPMVLGKYRCSWGGRGFSYACVVVETQRDSVFGPRWQVVYRTDNPDHIYDFRQGFPSDLKRRYNAAIAAYERLAAAWGQEQEIAR